MTAPEPVLPEPSTPRGLAGRTGWWAALLVVAALSYLYGLDGQHVPRIGDEMPYAQVTRLTAASGRLLPLQADDPVLKNTKPPLLFWLGMATTGWGEHWTLWRLRFPIVLVTFVVALVTFLLGRALTGTAGGLLAAVVFLGFFATFRYGRPFLTNLPETLFAFLPFAVAVARPAWLDRWAFWAFAALSLGIACWVKSFALVAPVGFAFAWWMFARRGWRLGAFLRQDAPKLAVFGTAALGLFLLWPLVDPDGRSIFENFVGRENLGKIASEGNYFVDLVAGRHSVWLIWFGPLLNVGLYAVVTLALAIDAWRRRRALSDAEKALWIFVFAFMVVYTFPAHRVENYLLPTAPALAVLIALRWQAFGNLIWRISSAITLGGGLVAVGFVVLVVRGGYFGWGDWSPLALAVPVAVVALSLWVLGKPRAGTALFPLAVLLAHGSIACVTAPFEGPKGVFDERAQAAARGRVVHVPSNFRSAEERFRFLLPGSKPVGYDPDAGGPSVSAVPEGASAPLVVRRVGAGTEDDAAQESKRIGERLVLLSRQKLDDVRALLFEGKTDSLVQRETLYDGASK